MAGTKTALCLLGFVVMLLAVIWMISAMQMPSGPATDALAIRSTVTAFIAAVMVAAGEN